MAGFLFSLRMQRIEVTHMDKEKLGVTDKAVSKWERGLSLLLLLLMKVRIHNKALKFLGKISLELILLENVFILYFAEWILRDLRIFVLLVLTATLIFATIINKIKLYVLEKKE